MLFEYIVEEGEYAFMQLFADLGAVWGMYLGIAFATLWELVDMIFLLLYVFIARMFGFVSDAQVKAARVCDENSLLYPNISILN